MLLSSAQTRLNDKPAEQEYPSALADTPRLHARQADPTGTRDCVLSSLMVRKAERRGKVGYMYQTDDRGACNQAKVTSYMRNCPRTTETLTTCYE